MRAVQALARQDGARLRFVTFSVDPDHDDPEVLKSYAEAYGLDSTNWTFLTGSASSIKEIARSFSVAFDREVDPTRPDFGIMHSGHMILVDEKGRIRAYYSSNQPGVEQTILANVKQLGDP
jgi:protein SCO1/2